MPFQSCDYRVQQENDSTKMVINCRDCENSFDVNDCLPGIILALQNEYNIDNLVLSDYIEHQYSDESLKILIKLKDIIEEMEVFSERKTSDKNCKNCELEPKKMYDDLAKSVLDNSDDIFKKFVSYSKTLIEKEECLGCRSSAKEELYILGNKLIDIRSEILLQAYDILE